MIPENPLVSIIIPTYNRAHLIGETLDSVLAQTYWNWECIVVDDGSMDNTAEVMTGYLERDARFQYHHRPVNRPKGANACRNYGFELSKGVFVNWFDSDDLMTEDNLRSKIGVFRDNIDFVIGNSINFDKKDNYGRAYELHYDLPITPENFITGQIGWITNDVLIRKEAVHIKFNEELQSGQEYNFFSRLLYHTTKGEYLKKDVAKRRVHSNSIQETLKENDFTKNRHLFTSELILLQDIKMVASKEIIERSLKRLIRFSYYITSPFSLDKNQKKVLSFLWANEYYTSYIIYIIWMVNNLIMGRGYIFVQFAIKAL